MDFSLVIRLGVFGAVVLASYAALDGLMAPERQVKVALKNLSVYENAQAREAEPMLRPFPERVLAPIVKLASEMGRAATPSGYTGRLQRQLAHAGEPRGITPEGLLTIKLLAIPLAIVILGPAVVFLFVTGSRLWSLLFALLVPAAFFLPDVWLSRIAKARSRAIRLALPDMLDMLTISVEAGMGLDAALAKVVANTNGPLTGEFAKVLLEIQAGVSRRDAFRNMVERTDAPELTSFISAIIQADVFGVSVSHVLRVQAAEMRTRRRQNAEELAQKAPVKLVFPLVLCILPATLIVIVGPAVMSIVRMFGG
jgi:tight adherence protein C